MKTNKSAKYFTAPWCGPCRMYGPIINQLVEEGYTIEKINVDSEISKATEYSVMSVPTVVIEDESGVTDILVGVHSLEEIKEKLS